MLCYANLTIPNLLTHRELVGAIGVLNPACSGGGEEEGMMMVTAIDGGTRQEQPGEGDDEGTACPVYPTTRTYSTIVKCAVNASYLFNYLLFF